MLIHLFFHSIKFRHSHTSNRKRKGITKKGKCKGKQPSSIEWKIEKKENLYEKQRRRRQSVMEIQELRCHNLSITLLECRMSCSVITHLHFSCKSQLTKKMPA